MLIERYALALLGLAIASGVGPAQEPRAIIEGAIEAHGGLAKLSKARADWVKMRGTLYIADQQIPFVGETWVQLPNKFRNVMQLTSEKGTYSVVQILNGDKAWVSIDGKPQKVSPSAAAEMREILQLDTAIRLVPLLRNPNFQLDFVGESKVNDKPVLGVRVQAKGRKELRMYFDKATGLLVKTEHLLTDPNGKAIRQEGFYTNFREVGGYKRPLKMIAFRNGKKVMEADLVDVKYYDKIDDEKFTLP